MVSFPFESWDVLCFTRMLRDCCILPSLQNVGCLVVSIFTIFLGVYLVKIYITNLN
jgi:hypothetical protein